MKDDDDPQQDSLTERLASAKLEETPYEWIIQSTILDDNRLHYPTEVKETIHYDHPKGKSVFWNVESNSEFIVLSTEPIFEDYEYIERNTIESFDVPSARVRAPKSLSDRLSSKFYKGNRVFYVATSEMVFDDNPSTFLLEESELIALLPGIEGGGEESEVFEAIMENPGFLPINPF